MELKIANTKINGNLLFAILLFIDIIVITAVDIYVPALPNIRDEFSVSESYLNITIFVFMFFGGIAVLLTAPLGDKYGRRPIMLASTVSFSLGSLICIVAPNVEFIIIGRIFQAFGMGGVEALATTIIKEAYDEKSLKTAMSMLQSLVLLGPLIAPFAGTLMLALSGWRAIFFLLLVLGIICVILSFFVPETKPNQIPKRNNIKNLKEFSKDSSFYPIVLVLGLSGLPFFAYIGVFSYICFDMFNNDYMTYNLLYALACIISLLAPFLYQLMSKKISNTFIFAISMILILVSFVLFPIIGFESSLLLTIAFFPYVLCEGIVRPLSFMIILNQPEERVGAASSLGNFSYTIITAFGSVIATLNFWPDYITALWGILGACFILNTIILIPVWKNRNI